MIAIDAIKSLMSTSATGYAAMTDGIIDIRTVCDNANAVALNVFATKGIMVMSNCAAPDCDCMVKLLAESFPDVKIAGVEVKATNQSPIKKESQHG